MTTLYELLNEDTAVRPTTQGSRKGWVFLASVLIGITICVPVFVMGTQIAHQISLTSFVIGAFLGGVLASLIAVATGMIGIKTGLPTAMLAKMTFGTWGYVIANLALLLGGVGWFGIQTSVFSQSFIQLSQSVWGVSLDTTSVTIISGLLMSTTAIIGFRGLGKLSYIAVPLLLVMLFLPLYVLFSNGALANVPLAPQTATLTIGALVAMVAGAYSFSTTMPDITRYLRTTKDLVIGAFLNFALVYPLLLILTGVMALAAGQNDIMAIMLSLGFGGMAIAVLFLATWTTNDTNVYVGALSVQTFLPQFARWKIAAAVGVMGTIFALAGIFDHFMSWLILSGNLYAPMAGVYVMHYWLSPKDFQTEAKIPTFRPRPLCAWVIGVMVGLCTTPPAAMGFGLLTLSTVPMVDGLIAAALVQYVLFRIKR